MAEVDDTTDTVPSTTGGAARAVAAAAERMRETPPPLMAESDLAEIGGAPAREKQADAAPDDAGDKPAPREASPDAPAKRSSQDDESDSKEKAPTRLVSAANLKAAPAGDGAEKAERSEKWAKVLARYGGDAEKAAEAFLQMESKVAADANKAKGGKNAPGAEGAAADTTDTTEAPTDAEIESAVAERVHQFAYKEDPTCQTLNRDYIANRDRVDAICKVEGGVPVSGELVDLAGEIRQLKGLLDEKSPARKYATPDPVALEDAQRDLERALDRQERLLSERERLVNANAKLKSAWDDRLQSVAKTVREQLKGRIVSQRAAESFEADTEAAVAEFEGLFKDATEGLSKEDRADARRVVTKAIKAALADGEDADFGTIINAEMKLLRASWARRDGLSDKERARLKESSNRQPAPRGPAARADESPDLGSLSSKERRKLAESRATRLSRDIVAQ